MRNRLQGLWERYYPCILSVVAFCASYKLPITKISTKIFYQMNSNMISISAIIIGFVTTLVTILIALNDTRSMRFIQKAGRYHQLLAYMRTPIQSSFILAILSVFLSFRLLHNDLSWVVKIWIATTVFVGSSLYRVTTIIFILLNSKPIKNGKP